MGLHATPIQFDQIAVKGLTGKFSARDEDPTALKAIGTTSHFTRNQTVFSEGEPAAYAFKILSGAVRLFKLLPDGRRQIAGFRLAGDYFGLDGEGSYMLNAESLSDLIVIRYARSHLSRLEAERGDVRNKVMDMLRRDLWAAQNQLIMLGKQSARERVASFLLQLAERDHLENGDAISIPMGRQDMADYLGLTIETVCRVISELKRIRTISVPDRHRIILTNMEALRALAEGDE